MTEVKAQRLGLIIPEVDSGFNRVEDCEIHHYGYWMEQFGFPLISMLEVSTKTNGRHDIESVFEAGRSDRLAAAAKELSEEGCDVVAWPCTCASFIGGLEWSRAQAATMATASGRPATSTSLAMLQAVEELRADTVDVLGAYPAATTHRFLRFLDEAGVGVVAMVSLNCADELESNNLDIREEVMRFDNALSQRTHPLLIPDTAIDTIGLIGELEEALGRPVVSGNQATLWHSLRLLGQECRIPGAGLLLGGA